MHLEDGFAPAHIRPIQHHAPVKAARAQQRRVQNIRAVRRRHDDDIGIGVKTVHLNQQLIERLLAFIMTAAQSSAALTANRINFVNKDNTGRMPLGLVKQVTHPAGAHAYKHFHKLRTRDGEEGYPGLTRYGFG